MKKFFGVGFLVLGFYCGRAQEQSTVQEGEFGVSLGAAHYFGDLNPDLHLNRPKLAFGLFYRKQMNNYVSVRLSGHFAQLGYSDIYNTQNEFMSRRNLSFNTNIWEGTVQGDFNFFKFVPGDGRYRYTPYLTIGLGIFSYDPYAYLNNVKYYLRPLGTEGQGTAAYPDRKPYGTTALCLPLGLGFKYNLNPSMNIGFEVVYRFTTTDYLDDVSKTYVGIDKFPQPNGIASPAALLQDRSYETGTPIGIEGRQRGYSNQKDSYVMAEVTLSFNISSYRCPTAK